MLQALIFDFDGVVVDSEPVHYEAIRQTSVAMLRHDFSYDDYHRNLIGFDDRDAFRFLIEQTHQAVAPDFLQQLCQDKQQRFDQLAQQGIATIPGTVELIDEAARLMPIAVASGATQADIRLILAGLDRLDAFQTIVAADDVQRSKPDPQTYADAAARLGIPPRACLAIEDTAAGLASAKAAGLRTLGLTTTGPASQLADAERILPNLAGVNVQQLQDWFKEEAP